VLLLLINNYINSQHLCYRKNNTVYIIQKLTVGIELQIQLQQLLWFKIRHFSQTNDSAEAESVTSFLSEYWDRFKLKQLCNKSSVSNKTVHNIIVFHHQYLYLEVTT